MRSTLTLELKRFKRVIDTNMATLLKERATTTGNTISLYCLVYILKNETKAKTREKAKAKDLTCYLED